MSTFSWSELHIVGNLKHVIFTNKLLCKRLTNTSIIYASEIWTTYPWQLATWQQCRMSLYTHFQQPLQRWTLSHTCFNCWWNHQDLSFQRNHWLLLSPLMMTKVYPWPKWCWLYWRYQPQPGAVPDSHLCNSKQTSLLWSRIVLPQFGSQMIQNTQDPCSCMNEQHIKKPLPPRKNLQMIHLVKLHSPLHLNNMLIHHKQEPDNSRPTSQLH